MLVSPEEFGLFSLAAGIVATVIALSPLGFSEALVQRETLTKSHVDTVFALTVGYGVLAGLALWAAAPLLAGWTGQPQLQQLLWFMALKVPLDVAVAAPSALIVRSMQFRAVAVRTALAFSLNASIAIYMLLNGYGIWALAVGQVTGSAVILIVSLYVARWRPSGGPTLAAGRELFRYGAFASGSKMLPSLRLDHVILGLLAGEGALGLFVLAQRLQQMLTMVFTGAWASVTHVLLSSLQTSKEKTRQAFGLASFGSAAIGIPGFAGAALLIDDLIVWAFDDRWAEASLAAQLFCLVGLLSAIGSVQGSAIKSRGRADLWFYYLLAQQFGTLAMLAIFSKAGLTAIVTAIVVKTYLLWPISVVLTVRAIDIPVWDYLKSFAAPLVSVAAMVAAMLAVEYAMADDPAGLRLLVTGLTGAAVYLPVLYLLSRRRVADLLTIIRNRSASS